MNYTGIIAQLTTARGHCERTIAAMEKASSEDNVDRSGSIASIKRDMASYDRQLADYKARQEASDKAATEKPKKPDPKS